MSNARNKEIHQADWQLVHKVLNEHWDPLDVADLIDNEYDRYVGAICHMLMDRKLSKSDMSHYLYITATQRMLLTPYPRILEGCEKTAAILVGLRSRFETH